MQPVSTRPRPFTREADFRQERDFGAKISATFDFIRANFRALVKTLAYFVLPGALVAGVGMGTFTNLIYNQMPTPGTRRTAAATQMSAALLPKMFGGMGVASLAFLVSFLLITGALYSFVRVRLALPADEDVQPSQVWAFMRPRLGKALLAVVVLGAAGVLVSMGAGLVLAGTAAGGISSPVAVFFGVLGLFVLFTWLAVVLTLFFPILWLEDAGIGQALKRAFFLVKGKWWSTFGLLLISTIIQSFVAFVFIIPQYAVMFGKVLKIPYLDSDLLGIAGQCIYSLGLLFTYAIPLLAIMFQYFSLVERREGTGSFQLLGQLGQAPAPGVASGLYRPDEEGEY
ncbi:hypothetical protein ACFQ48_08475 [Hymenobacter caeli]|uniref:Glycerophosphoryl diester phosphodiesterase membrane domain-containing protein n=1 Tax=Hymenobacter caeli TaxID=2735894 RepID=A0ABX2FPK5_9BACT|nr:hypothetical protein [Hymenobacter caeli]NRT19108.1 hypothetical protein [Hymenobacter caeli]